MTMSREYKVGLFIGVTAFILVAALLYLAISKGVLERIHTEGPWTPLLDGSPLSLYGQTAEEAFKLMKRHVKHERNRFDELWDLFE